jgi:hypothetical protein
MGSQKAKQKWPPGSLGSGEYVLPDPEKNFQAHAARIVLIESTRRVLPNFLKSLHDSVYPEFCLLPKELRVKDGLLGRLPEIPPDCAERIQFDKTLRALELWMEKFNAVENWVRDGAWRSMHYWGSWPVHERFYAWFPSLGPDSIPLCDTGPFRFEHLPWFMEVQRWPKYEERLKEKFKKALTDYRERCDAIAKANALLPVRRTYSAQNLDWFALYQFGGLSSTKIAAKVGGVESAILKGVKAAQRLLAWEDLRRDYRATRKTR